MTKYEIENSFHRTSMTIAIKDADQYEAIGNRDVLIGLESSRFSDDDRYARRKLAEIKRTLCGSRVCTCGGLVSATRV